MIFRHEHLLSFYEQSLGNEHARRLLAEGIPPFLDTYLRYVGSGDFGMVNRFWLAGISGGTDFQGRSDLHIACLMGHPAIVQELLRRGADPTKTTSEGHTALMMAAVGGNARILELLFDHRSLPNATTSDGGCSALYMAASRGHLKAVQSLIAHGALIDQIDGANEKFDVASALVAAGADVKRVDAIGATLMDYAKAFNCPPDILGMLQERGVKISDLRNSGGGSKWDGSVRVRWEKETVSPQDIGVVR